MALDDRIKTGVCMACMTRYHDLIAQEDLKAHGIYYFVPNMLKYLDTDEVIPLAAPRPILFLTGDSDLGSPVDGEFMSLKTRLKRCMPGFTAVRAISKALFIRAWGTSICRRCGRKTLSWMDKNLGNAK